MTHWLFFAWKLTFLRTQGRLQSSNWLDIVVMMMMMMMMIMMTKKDDLQRAMMPSQQVELHSKNWVVLQHFLIVTISIVIITMFKIVTHPSILIKAAFLLLSYLPFNVPLNAVNESSLKTANHIVFWRFVVMIMIAGNPNQPEMKSEAQGMFSDRWDIKVADDVFFFTCPLFIFSPCKWVSFSCSIQLSSDVQWSVKFALLLFLIHRWFIPPSCILPCVSFPWLLSSQTFIFISQTASSSVKSFHHLWLIQ